MKIITWNCNMAFRKKAAMLLKYRPDIVVVQECEHPDKLIFSEGVDRPNDMLWIGTNQHKGLGILSYSDFRIKLSKSYNPANLLAIWAHNPDDKDGQYVTQVWKALDCYKTFINRTNTVLIGDFNSNTTWDRPRRKGNHSDVVSQLARKGIHSTYHQYFGQEQGKEADPTHYLYRHEKRKYHLDYCFASGDLLAGMKSVEVGAFDTWCPHSDHVPIIVVFDV
jgi:exodeoxyribonuclease III